MTYYKYIIRKFIKVFCLVLINISVKMYTDKKKINKKICNEGQN